MAYTAFAQSALFSKSSLINLPFILAWLLYISSNVSVGAAAAEVSSTRARLPKLPLFNKYFAR